MTSHDLVSHGPVRSDRQARRAWFRTIKGMSTANLSDPNPLILDVSDTTFQSEVLERSSDLPVIVDLWAAWCGPCHTLGPILEKVVTEQDGKVLLVTIDVDANPLTASAFQVQSIPAVYAMRNGEVLDGFVGSRPEHAVREFVASVLAAG